jgi:hypothetical protein
MASISITFLKAFKRADVLRIHLPVNEGYYTFPSALQCLGVNILSLLSLSRGNCRHRDDSREPTFQIPFHFRLSFSRSDNFRDTPVIVRLIVNKHVTQIKPYA